MSALATLMPGFVGTTLPDWVERLLREGMGGVCLFGENVESAAQVRELTDAIYAANPYAIVSMDEEGGDVSRLYQHRGSPFPGAAVLGRLADADTSFRVGEQVGWELRTAGVGLALAPVVDVNSNPNNPVIGTRSFGADAQAVGVQAAAWIRGLESTGVAANAKHFPGHGDTDQDSHVALPTVRGTLADLTDRELAPFRAAIAAGARTIMTSHIVVPALDAAQPATFSAEILQGLLRDQMGFTGVIVTDALDMVGASGEMGIPAAAVRALAAGSDLLCIGTKNNEAQLRHIVAAIELAVATGELAEDRVADASHRVRQLGEGLAAQRRQVQVPVGRAMGSVPNIDTTAVAGTFAVAPAAAEALAAIASGTPFVWLRLEPAANIAVGDAPWGPFVPDGVVAAATLVSGGERDALLASVPAGAIAIVVGKDNHRHPWACAAIDDLRESRQVVAVDMGWPEPTHAYADIATFGASRLVGDALRGLIG